MNGQKINAETVRAHFDDPRVVDHYRRATANIGLWRTEEHVLTKCFAPADRILDIGTGTGRIALGLAEIGYRNVMGIDFSREMVAEARRIASVLELGVPFRQGDATRLAFEDGLFDGAIFGFNGLMQIPGADNRRAALREIRRVIRASGLFVFTTHDRDHPRHRDFWLAERERWDSGTQAEQLLDYGDRLEDCGMGVSFMHVPTRAEIIGELHATGWLPEWDSLRSDIGRESPPTNEFADECRFWVARKPA